jgi:hypothetical protein
MGVYDYTDADQFIVSVEYLPGGKIQNLILPPSLQVENEDDPWSQKDFWNYLGLLFETVYWIFLADFGQISPTEYPRVDDAVNTGNFSVFDFSVSETLPFTNNIFVNSSLYQIAWSTGTESLYPPSFWQVPAFNNTKNFPLTTNETVFIQSYLCEQRRLKSPFSLFITVVVADYALIAGAYNFAIWIAVIIEKRQKRNGNLSGLRRAGLGPGQSRAGPAPHGPEARISGGPTILSSPWPARIRPEQARISLNIDQIR